MRNNIISLKNASHLSFAALALLEVNNLGIISSELLSSYSTTYLYPALAVGTIILGALNVYRSAKNIDECLKSFRDRYSANFDDYSNPLAQAVEQDFKSSIDINQLGENIIKLGSTTAFFIATTAIFNIGYFPLLFCTSIAHLNLVVFNDKTDALLKAYIPEEHLKIFNQDTFASRVLNKLSSTLMLQ